MSSAAFADPIAVPVSLMVSAPAQAHAGVERHGVCGSGHYEFSVERDHGGFEVSLDLHNVKPGSKWKVVLRHDGKSYFNRTLLAHHHGHLEVERWRKNTAGKDTFRFRAARVGGSASCTRAITVS